MKESTVDFRNLVTGFKFDAYCSIASNGHFFQGKVTYYRDFSLVNVFVTVKKQLSARI